MSNGKNSFGSSLSVPAIKNDHQVQKSDRAGFSRGRR